MKSVILSSFIILSAFQSWAEDAPDIKCFVEDVCLKKVLQCAVREENTVRYYAPDLYVSASYRYTFNNKMVCIPPYGPASHFSTLDDGKESFDTFIDLRKKMATPPSKLEDVPEEFIEEVKARSVEGCNKRRQDMLELWDLCEK